MGRVTTQPDAPLSGWFLLTLLVVGVAYLVVRSVRHHWGWRVRLGAVVGGFFVLLSPSLAVGVTQDLTCRDSGVLSRPDGSVLVVCVTAAALLGLLGLVWVTGDRLRGAAWRLAVIPAVLIVPVAMVEVMAAALPLEDYCDGLRGVLHLQAGLALLVPVAAMALAAVPSAPSGRSRVPGAVVMGSVVALLPVQAATLADRVPASLVCVTRGPLPSDTLTMRGSDTNLSIAAADFDGDGASDLGGFDTSGTARVLRNDGHGTFTPGASAALSPAFAPSGAVAAGDLDGNGHADLVVAGSEVRPQANQSRRRGVAVVLNDGRSLRPRDPLLLPGDGGIRDIAVGDLDGDGNVEVVVLDGGTVAVLRDRNGDLAPGPRLGAPPPAGTDQLGQRRFALADADGDGRLDVVSWVLGSSYYGEPSYVILHRNGGDGRFTSAVVATIDGGLGAVAVADFDDDRDVDLLVNGPGGRLRVLLNRGDGRFDLTSRPARVRGEDIWAADVDVDGRQDLVMTTGFVSDEVEQPGFLWVRLNRGGLSFSDTQLVAIPRELVVIADLNGDRRPDYVVDESDDLTLLTSVPCRP